MFLNLPSAHEMDPAPWERETLEWRLSQLLFGEGRRVAYLYGVPDNSSFRYRVYNMVEALRDQDHGFRVSWFRLSEIATLRRVLMHLDVLVLARLQYSGSVADLICAARGFGVRVIFEADDLVFDVRYAHLVSVNNDQYFDSEDHLNFWYAYVGRISCTAALCDGGITTNSFLAQKMEDVCNGPVRVVPNFLNRRQETFSREILRKKIEGGFARDENVTIGYFSGSPSHNNDFRYVVDALADIMTEDPNLCVRVVGYLPALDKLGPFGSRLELLPFQDWIALQSKIGEVEINIAPLGINDFTQCKSELKFFEAAAVGSFSVVSNTFPFSQSAGLSSAAEVIENSLWPDALRSTIVRVREGRLFGETAIISAEEVYEKYGWSSNTAAIIEALSP